MTEKKEKKYIWSDDSKTHKSADSLAHRVSETSYHEVVRVDGVTLGFAIWATAEKSLKIRDVSLARSEGRITEIVTTHYDDSGTIVETETQTISRSGGTISSIQMVKS
jgi:hypothetical protein